MGYILLRECLMNQLFKDFLKNPWALFFFPVFFYSIKRKVWHFMTIVISVNIMRIQEEKLIISPLIFFPTSFLPFPPWTGPNCSTPFSFLMQTYTNRYAHMQCFQFYKKILSNLPLLGHGLPFLHSQISFAKFFFLRCKDSQFELGWWGAGGWEDYVQFRYLRLEFKEVCL